QRVHLGGTGSRGQGITATISRGNIADYFARLANRLCDVRVCSGDWSRVCAPTPTYRQGVTGVFLDPPYPAGGYEALYRVGSRSGAADVRDWAVGAGRRSDMKIAFCGYADTLDMPKEWRAIPWKAAGYGGGKGGRGDANSYRERIWLSPACNLRQLEMFA